MKTKKIKLIVFLLSLTIGIIAIIRFRLGECYSINKSKIIYTSNLKFHNVRLIHKFERIGEYDSSVYLLDNDSETTIPDYYGKQDFIIYVDSQRWYPNLGFFKFKKWYKVVLNLSIDSVNSNKCLIKMKLSQGSQIKSIEDTIILMR